MLLNGCEYAVIEASSHGLSTKLNRLGNVLFDCGVFMNVTLEHLEFHKNFETYRSDKANLFRSLDKHNHIKTIGGEQRHINSIGIVNLEDESASYFISQTKHHVYGFTTEGKAGKAAAESGSNATPLPQIPENLRYMTARNIASATYGLSFSVDADGTDALYPENYDPVQPRPHSHFEIKASLPGAFNAYNLMAAITAVSSVTELSFEEVAEKVQTLVPIKGRMTVIDEGQPFEVIIEETYNQGWKAAELAYNYLEGKELPHYTPVDLSIKYRQSCGCECQDEENISGSAQSIQMEYVDLTVRFSKVYRTLDIVQNIHTIDDIYNALPTMIDIADIRGIGICLYDEPITLSKEEEFELPDKAYLTILIDNDINL